MQLHDIRLLNQQLVKPEFRHPKDLVAWMGAKQAICSIEPELTKEVAGEQTWNIYTHCRIRTKVGDSCFFLLSYDEFLLEIARRQYETYLFTPKNEKHDETSKSYVLVSSFISVDINRNAGSSKPEAFCYPRTERVEGE